MCKYQTPEVQNSFWSLKHPLDSDHETRRKNRSGKPFIGSHCIFAWMRSGDKEDPKDVIRFLCQHTTRLQILGGGKF